MKKLKVWLKEHFYRWLREYEWRYLLKIRFYKVDIGAISRHKKASNYRHTFYYSKKNWKNNGKFSRKEKKNDKIA